MTSTISLFGALHLDPETCLEGGHDASVEDIMALLMDYRYVPSPALLKALYDCTPAQRGNVFTMLKSELRDLLGESFQTLPLYRDFPNHEIVPFELRVVLWIARHLGIDIVEFDRAYYGADPVTGFPDDTFTTDPDLDAAFHVELEDGSVRRDLRFLKLADNDFIRNKVIDIMSNLTPLSSGELEFVEWAISAGYATAEDLQVVKFREKLPLLRGLFSTEDYAAMCNSVTDALRLAVHLTGTTTKKAVTSGYGWSYTPSIPDVAVEPDLSLKTPPRFDLKTSEAKKVVDLVEHILVHGSTDFETDFLRHEEKWKRFAEHVRIRQFTKRAPKTVEALVAVRSGEMQSWEARYEKASLEGKIDLAMKRPGAFIRRLAALHRGVSAAMDRALEDKLLRTCRSVFPQVDVMKLLQLHVHLTRTLGRRQRIHALPDGTLMASEAEVQDMFDIASELEGHLSARLSGILPWAPENEDLKGLFVPAANRTASQSDQRFSRGDRTTLNLTDADTVRAFLHWKERCDVDLSVLSFNASVEQVGSCSYMSLTSPACRHSGDILDGSAGAAEYVDIQVGEARGNGIRYLVLIGNVFSGSSFDHFPCYIGAMIRDGKSGSHLEPSTVETKMSLDSDKRATTAAILDLETGELIYADTHANWRERSNVRTEKAGLKQTLEYIVDYHAYRATFEDVLRFAGTEGGLRATCQDVRDDIDGVLSKLSAA
ncbi:TerD family protein [Salipiger mucosus]|uniref:Uncharacterized protein n=1 Tax=Salipiger mucosus DSM 16094 TaxID=1123237 RepID=S9RS08_9RHOB|nr:TerD family protein [Salipiger mucosus]EPX76754.1 hypothetical protein Salmuc_04640 [Salipiger mucosus DSM 16094]